MCYIYLRHTYLLNYLLQQSYHKRATAYGELMPNTLLNSSVLRWLQKQDDDEDKPRMAAGREFQAAGPQTVRQLRAWHYQDTAWRQSRQEQAVVVSLINAKNSSKTENYTELHGDTSIIISDKHTVQPILPLSEKQSGIHKKTYIFSLFSVFRSIITKILEIILWHNCWQKRQPVCKSHASKSQKFGFRLCIKCGVKTKYWKQQYDHLHELYSLHTKNSKTCHWWLINTFYSILSQQQ